MAKSSQQKRPKCVLSIDVGLHNLALCVLSSQEGEASSTEHVIDIRAWDLVNVLSSQSHCVDSSMCSFNVRGRNCKRRGVFPHGSDMVCKQHAIVLGIDVTSRVKRPCLKDVGMFDIVLRIMQSLDEICIRYQDDLSLVDHVVIEKQPMENNKMQLVSHVVYVHFVRFFDGQVPVTLLPAYHKLSVYNGPPVACTLKTRYAQRKFHSVQYTSWMLSNKICNHELWTGYFASQKKKDDLGDAFLQGIFILTGTKYNSDGTKTVRKKRKRGKLHF